MATSVLFRLNAPGFLLLLMGVITTNLPAVHSKPIDYWCKDPRNETLVEIIKTVEMNCTDLDTLSSPVQLPCTGINSAWNELSVGQKKADVENIVRRFLQDVQNNINETNTACKASSLENLKDTLEPLLFRIIKTNVVSQPSSSPTPENCGTTNSLKKMKEPLTKFFKGKLDRFARDYYCMETGQQEKCLKDWEDW